MRPALPDIQYQRSLRGARIVALALCLALAVASSGIASFASKAEIRIASDAGGNLIGYQTHGRACR